MGWWCAGGLRTTSGYFHTRPEGSVSLFSHDIEGSLTLLAVNPVTNPTGATARNPKSSIPAGAAAGRSTLVTAILPN
jgi:hypothetical protein